MKIELKRKDKILIIVILCIAVSAYFLHYVLRDAGSNLVTVKVNGVIEGTYNLKEDQEIKINGGTNILAIKNGEADMVEADCPDKLCVNQKPVSRNRENIICLPNKVIAEVQSLKDSEVDAVTN